MKITQIKNNSDFIALKDGWKGLLQRSDHSVFSTWEWLSTWWKHFGSNKQLVILLAEQNNGIIGIAPLMYSVYTMLGLRQGKIEFIGTPHSDYNDFIIADKSEECLRLFMDYLNDLPEKWNNIQLTDVPQNSKCITTLNGISKNIRLVGRCPYIPLPNSHEAFLSNLSRKLRKNLRSRLRRLEKNFKVDFVDCSEIQSCADGMNQFFELHQKRWKSKGYPGEFSNREFRNFHYAIARSFSEKGWLSLVLLKLSDEPAAALYGFKYRSKLYAYLSGFDPRYSRYGIGTMLDAYTIGKCIQEGLSEFDFMRGAEAYKYQWNTMTRRNLEVTIPRRGFLAGFRSLLYRKYWSQGTRLKRALFGARTGK